MAVSLSDVPLDRVGRRARSARPGLVVLTLITWILLNAGWVTARVLGALWLSVAWAGASFAEGFSQGWAQVREQRRR